MRSIRRTGSTAPTQAPTVRKVVDHARLIVEVDSSCPIIMGRDGRVMDGMRIPVRAAVGKSPVLGAS